jgi:hypothetical protein
MAKQDLLDYLKSMRRCDDYELIGEELENVKKNACYCAGCPHRISVL